MTPRTTLTLVTLVLGLSAQTPAPTPGAPSDTSETLPVSLPTPGSDDGGPSPYVREVWTYSSAGRSDPLHPPSTLRDGSNLPDLIISGILLNVTNPSRSQVAFRFRSGERTIVSVGDTIPPFVVTAIEANRVQIRYPQLGGVSQRWIERPKPASP